MVELILLGIGGYALWQFMSNRDSQPSRPDWREYEIVGESPDKVQVIIQGNFQFGVPKLDEWLWRVATVANGVTTPVAGKSKDEAVEQFGINESTDAVPSGKWGVPYSRAVELADLRLTSISGVQGPTVTVVEESETLEELPQSGQGQAVGEVETVEVLTVQEFPNVESNSFEGFNIQNENATDLTSGGYSR